MARYFDIQFASNGQLVFNLASYNHDGLVASEPRLGRHPRAGVIKSKAADQRPSRLSEHPMSTPSNPFAVLLDPVAILASCTQSGALDALPLSAKRCADRQSPRVAGELAEHDAAVDAIYQALIAKAAKAPAPKASTKSVPKSKKSLLTGE
jgi:hypothetical protein